MPTRRTFLGIASGTTVALTLQQAGLSVTGQTGAGGWANAATSPSKPTKPSNLAVSVSIEQPSPAISPLPIRLEAHTAQTFNDVPASGVYASAYDLNFNKPEYVWTFGEMGDYTAPENMLPGHRDKSRGTGKFISRVFRCPEGQGSVDVSYRCDVFWPDGSHGFATGVVKVNDRASSFAAAETIVVSGEVGETWTDAPTHIVTNRVSNFEAAFARLDQLNLTKAQICFKRGQTYPVGTKNVNFDDFPNLIVSTFGGGEKPVIDYSAQSFGSLFTSSQGSPFKRKFFTVDNVCFEGGWDPTTEWNETSNAYNVAKIFFLAENGWYTMTQCVDNGSVMTFEGRQDTKVDFSDPPMHIFFEDSVKSNNKDFVVLSNRNNQRVSVIGSRCVQNTNALNGAENRGTTGYGLYGRNSHNFLRCNSEGLYVGHCDVFCRHGWTIQYAIIENRFARLNRSDITNFRAIFSSNHLEGAFERQGSSSDGLEHCNMVFERNLWTGSPSRRRHLGFQSGGATIRNNIFIADNIKRDKMVTPGEGTFKSFIGLSSDGIKNDALDMPFFIYGNTFVVLGDDNADGRLNWQGIVENDASYAHVVLENNVLYIPNSIKYRSVEDGPLDPTSLGFDARNDGFRIGYHRSSGQILASDVGNGASVTLPYGRSDLFGTTPTGSDFAGAPYNRHQITISDGGNTKYNEPDGEILVSFGANDVTIINNTGVTWKSGARVTLHLDRGDKAMEMDVSFATPLGTKSLYRPTRLAGAYEDATSGPIAMYDILGNVRPGTNHPDAASGNPSRGAIEPAPE